MGRPLINRHRKERHPREKALFFFGQCPKVALTPLPLFWTETKHLLTDADSSTNTKKILLVRQNLRQFYTLYKHKVSNLRPLLSITFLQGFQKSKKFGDWTLGSGGKKTFKQSEQMRGKKSVKKKFAAVILHPF